MATGSQCIIQYKGLVDKIILIMYIQLTKTITGNVKINVKLT